MYAQTTLFMPCPVEQTRNEHLITVNLVYIVKDYSREHKSDHLNKEFLRMYAPHEEIGYFGTTTFYTICKINNKIIQWRYLYAGVHGGFLLNRVYDLDDDYTCERDYRIEYKYADNWVMPQPLE